MSAVPLHHDKQPCSAKTDVPYCRVLLASWKLIRLALKVMLGRVHTTASFELSTASSGSPSLQAMRKSPTLLASFSKLMRL